LSGFWVILGGVLLLVIGLLVWLAKRAAGRGEEDSTGVWEALDSDEEIDNESRASTERLRALARDDDSTIVVVEQERGRRRGHAETRADGSAAGEETSPEASAQPAIEDTFSSETAINLDQSDPVAEADFHMAYGLYDQAADLINGALAADPERQDLMSKLCEIYFVWGNRDAFVDAASRLHDQMGGEQSPDWDKIVIMGQQIAADHKLFSGVSAGAATRAVDLSFDSDEGDGALDMDFASGPDGEVSEVIDLGGEGEDDAASADYSGLDFVFNEDAESGETITREIPKGEVADEETVENSALRSGLADTSADSPTVESPTMERPLDDEDGTSELPSVSDADEYAAQRRGDATAEIDLDDLGLDLDALAKTGLDADIDDADEDAANSDFSDLDETSENRALRFDPDATGKNRGLDDDGESSPFDLDDLDDLTGATHEMASLDETGKNPSVDFDDEGTDTGVRMDTTLLDATGQTQVLSGDIGVNTTTGNAASQLEDDDKTTLSPAFDDDKEDEEYEATAALQADDPDFDFTKTEALPKGAFDKDSGSAETGTVRLDSSEVDLDLDDLTSALRFSDGDTVDQPRDDATVEQPIVRGAGKSHQFVDLDFGEPGEEEGVATAQLAPEDLSDDLHDARTMTEVGTKLDLARAYVDMGDPDGARSILEEVLDEGDDGQRQQAQHLIDTLPA
ncbi:MAG: FimV/HubP family polar landmark protein, partial [Woeseia sp.]